MNRASGGCLECRSTSNGRSGDVVNLVRFDAISAQGVVQAVQGFLDCGNSHVIHFLAASPTVTARHDAAFRAVLNRADLNVADGMAVVWALRLFGCQAQRVTASSGFELLCRWGLARGLRHYLFGGFPDVVERLRTSLEQRHEGIHIVAADSPPFRPLSDEELRRTAESMRRARADLVWVGLGAPKQILVAERLREFGSAPVILTVGAAFDFVSGAKRRAPEWMQQAGLEWLHRLTHDPKRLWRRYLLGNPQFIAGVLADYTRTRRDA